MPANVVQKQPQAWICNLLVVGIIIIIILTAIAPSDWILAFVLLFDNRQSYNCNNSIQLLSPALPQCVAVRCYCDQLKENFFAINYERDYGFVLEHHVKNEKKKRNGKMKKENEN